MDLIDLIGDSRTDSLPPGFLRSIKIKYKQEASHVFPKGEKPKTAGEPGEPADRVGSAISAKSTPSFMGWQVPSRLVTRPPAPVPKTPASVLSYKDERQKLSSRLSGMSLRSAASLHKPVNKTEHLPRLSSVASSRKSVMERSKHTLPKLTTEEDVLEGLEKEEAISPQGRKVIRKILSEADKGRTSLSQKAISSNVMGAVDKWLVTATDKEREVALKFFSTLAGAKAEFLKNPSQKYHTHTDGNCHLCDGKRIDDALETLARGDSIVMRGKHAYNPKREPNLGHHSYYHLAKRRLPTRVRHEYQTWHHLPVYNYHDGVPNKSSMFTQPHKPLGRHFSIHPEWGLHTGIKHGAF